ncbi:glutamate-gated chloride channel A, partial [Aphelenchoides avenae]
HSYEKLLEEQRIIRRLLDNGPEGYDWRVRPRGTLNPYLDGDDRPVRIAVNMYLR